MEKIIETYKKQIFEYIGNRTKNGKCVFCGKELKTNEFCNCKKAVQKNRFFKKGYNKINELQNLTLNFSDMNEIRQYMASRYTTPNKFEGMDFDSYIIESESEKKGFNAVFEYYNQAVKNYIVGMNLILLGKYGTGKTMLMSILCESLAWEYLFSCKFVNAVDFIQKIVSTFGTSDKTVEGVIDNYKMAQFLFLDDIDKVKPSDYVREIFYAVVNYRTEHELPTIISANHSFEELDEKFYGEAIVSRLIQDAKIVNFTHQNRRFQR